MSPCESSRHLLEVEMGSKSCPWMLSTGQARGGSVRGPQGPGQQIPHRPSPGAPKLRPGGTLISPINPDTEKSVLTRRCSYSPRKFYSNFSIYLWLCWVFIAAPGLPLVAGFSLWWLLLLWNTSSRCVAQYLWNMGLVAL